jgi:hypothetical protein
VGLKLVYCEKCGTLNDDESFFCSSCGSDLPRSKSEPIVFGKSSEDVVKASPVKSSVKTPSKSPPSIPPPPRRIRFPSSKQFSRMKPDLKGLKRPKLSSPKHEKAQAVQSLIFGLAIITVSLGIALPESAEIIFAIGFTLIALLFLSYRALLSSRDPVFYIAVATGVITIAVGIAVDASGPIVLGIGGTITTLIYIYYRYRISERDPVFFIAFGVAVVSLGLQLTLDTSEPIILGIGFMITALIYLYYRYRISERDPLVFIIAAIVIITLGFALTLEESASLVFGIGFGLIGLSFILNGVIRPFLHSYNST